MCRKGNKTIACVFLRPHTRLAPRLAQPNDWSLGLVGVSLGRLAAERTPPCVTERLQFVFYLVIKLEPASHHRDFRSSRAANSGNIKDAAWTSGL